MTRTLIRDLVKEVGKTVELKGWVQTKRDHGKITFIDLRDFSGLIQVVGVGKLGDLHPEDVVKIVGLVKDRQANFVNKNLTTGSLEVEATSYELISASAELPMPLDGDGYDIGEETRLKYRYLDLRRPRMARNIRIRSAIQQFIRAYLSEKDFTEIDTPILTKTTPEGARDFLVPSRLRPGSFYALPQSPQQYKQMLMVAGFERYFQFARCFRDEDPRADRAYGEFTQLDMEMSFVTQEDILQLIETMFTEIVKKFFPNKKIMTSPWPRIPHKEAMAKYGTDKPDLRTNKADPDELAFSWTVDFPLFTEQSDADYFYGSGKAKFAPSHHMFTAPHPDDIPLLDTDPLKVRGLQHDLVLNGYEVGGGSIRIHQSEVQTKVFDLIGFTSQQKSDFQHMLTAFSYGVPPHGGIAPGIDRFLMAILGEPSVREVIAFPTSASGQTAVMDAPSPATNEQLAELSISVVPKAKTRAAQTAKSKKS
jgi:aspartyl-tRNA synthetase